MFENIASTPHVRTNIALVIVVAVAFSVLFLTGAFFAEKAYAVSGSLDQTLCESELDGIWDANACTISSDFQVDFGEAFTVPPDITLVIDNAAINNFGGIHNFGTIVNSGDINNEGDIFNSFSGVIENEGSIDSDDGANIGNAGKISNTGTIRNQGTFGNDFGGMVDNSGTINNSGSLVILFESAMTNSGTIMNSGTLTVANTGDTGGSGITNTPSGIINNLGEINIENHGTGNVELKGILNHGTIINSGKIIIENNASGVFAASTGIYNNLGTISNSGEIIVGFNSNVLNNFGIINSGHINAGATITNSGQITLTNSVGIGIVNGLSSTDTSTFTNSGTMAVANIGTSGTGIINQATYSNTGTIDIATSGLTVSNADGFVNRGDFSTSGTIIIRNSGDTAGLVNESGIITNSGEITVEVSGSRGAILNFATLTNDIEGIITNSGRITNTATGTLTNSHIFENCLTFFNQGTFNGNPVIDICDDDNDGIDNSVDTQPSTFSNGFSDTGIGGATTGTLSNRGGQTVYIVDAPSPGGVEIKADPTGGGNAANIRACEGSAFYTLTVADTVVVTCGSVITEVVQGLAEVEFFGAGGSLASAIIEAGFTLTFDPIDFAFFAPLSNPGDVSVTTGGSQVTISPGETVVVVNVNIDIKPGDTPNPINIKNGKTVTVALLGSSTFDVNSIDKSTLRFGGTTLQPSIETTLQKVNGDAFIDLLMEFKVPPLGFKATDTQGCVTGLLLDGDPFRGCDSVKIMIK